MGFTIAAASQRRPLLFHAFALDEHLGERRGLNGWFIKDASGGGAMLVNVVLGLALVVAVGGVAFAAGRATAPVTTASNRTGFGGNGQGGFNGAPNASGAPGGGFGAGAGGFGVGGLCIQGKVTAVGADSITLQLTSGQTVTIPTDSSTTFRQATSATAAAVTSGSTVVVQLQGGRGAFGNGNGNGNGGQGGATASGAPAGRGLGAASTVTVLPAGS
jgi:hypothetical protein